MNNSFFVELRLTTGRVEDCHFNQTFTTLELASEYLNKLPEPVSLTFIAGEGKLMMRDGTHFHFQFCREANTPIDLKAVCKEALDFTPSGEEEAFFIEDMKWALEQPTKGQVIQIDRGVINLPPGLTRSSFLLFLEASKGDYQATIKKLHDQFYFLRVSTQDIPQEEPILIGWEEKME